MGELSVSVRDLAAFCHRGGDIDYRFRPSPTGLQGMEGHQQLYRRRPQSYQSEYSLEYRADDSLLLRGRADGYDPEAGYVEEIKTCRVRPEAIPESISRLHLAQARLYGAMIALQEQRSELAVRLTWYELDADREHTLEQVYSAQELEDFLLDSLRRFRSWCQAINLIRAQRDISLEGMGFPYREFRAGQREMAELVYKCIDQSGQLMIEAPTGIGKTAAVLFPALKALAAGKHDRIAFLTAKSVGRRAAEDTLALFADAGYKGSAISLSAREKVCLSPGKACHGDDCPYARGYYDRLPDAMHAAIEHPILDRDALDAIARRFEVCPYQLALDLLPWLDIVVADIHHMFGLTGLLAGRIEEDGQRWTALVDEAHNLPSRARGMFSANLAKAELMAARQQAPKSIGSSLNRINRTMLDLQKSDWQEEGFSSDREQPNSLLETLRRFVGDCGAAQAADPALLHRQPELLSFFHGVLEFLRVADNWGEEYRFERSRGAGQQSLNLRLNCLDPSRLLGQRHERLRAVCAFSATLSPPAWMQASLGMGEQAVYRREVSPFAASQMEVTVATHVDTRYRQRERSMPALTDLLGHWLESVPGNCIVYFPSYRYLNDCLALLDLTALPSARHHWVQSRNQGEDDRAELLHKLASQRNLAAFCILGGVFGEGIDLPGELLTSVVVVGVGLPQVNRDTEQLREHYAAAYGQGFEYAYLYPGMQKVDQALGRVIRSSTDRGRALVIDSRFQRREYRELLPPWWTYVEHTGHAD